MGDFRLGDIIDDFCVKCKRIMNHAIVSMLNNEPAKVRCRTCHSDHDYRHEQPPPPKVDARKAALFNEVLAKVAPSVPVGDVPEPELEPEIDEPPETEEPIEEPPEEPEEPVRAKPAAKPKAKAAAKPAAKAKTKARK